MKRRKYFISFLAIIVIVIFLFLGCSNEENKKTVVEENRNQDKKILYESQIKPDELITLGNLEKDPWGINVTTETFNEEVLLKMDILSQEETVAYEKDGYELLGSPVKFSVEGKDNIRLMRPVLTTVNIPENYRETPVENLFFGYYADDTWHLYSPEVIDLEKSTASINLYHFSTYAMIIPTEEKQIENYAKNMAVRAWKQDDKNQEYLETYQEEYNNMFMSMGVQSQQVRNQLIADVLSYVDPTDIGLLDFMAQSANSTSKGKSGNLEVENKYKEYLGKAIYHAISRDPGSFSKKANVVGNLSTAAGAISGGDSKEALKAIANMLNASVPVSQLANATSNFIAEKSKETIDYWTNSEIEKAYEIYKTGEGGKYGYEHGLKGDFEGIFTVLGGLDRQLDINVVNKYCSKNGISPDDLSKTERLQIISDAKAALKNHFDYRMNEEAFLKEKVQSEKSFINALKAQGLLGPREYAKYFNIDKRGTNYNVNNRLNRLYNIKKMVLGMMAEEARETITDQSLAKAISQWIYWTEVGEQEKFYDYMKAVGLVKEMIFEDNFAWVYEEMIIHPWSEALDEKNKANEGIYEHSMSVDSNNAKFSITYVGPNNPSSWLKKGFSQAGEVSWTEPSPLIILPEEEVTMELSSSHSSRSHDYFSGIGLIAANYFKIDEKNEPYGFVTNLEDEDGNTYYTSTSANGYKDFSGVFKAELGSGAKSGDRLAIQVSASGGTGDFSAKIWYVYKWKAQ